MKLTDMIISAIIKKGVVYEARNAEMNFLIPYGGEESFISVQIQAEHMTIRVDNNKEELEIKQGPIVLGKVSDI